MTDSTASRILRLALFILVPAAYLSMVFWHPASAYGPNGPYGVSPYCAILMAAVFVVSLLSWNRHRIIALLGIVACFLWLVVLCQPVI